MVFHNIYFWPGIEGKILILVASTSRTRAEKKAGKHPSFELFFSWELAFERLTIANLQSTLSKPK